MMLTPEELCLDSEQQKAYDLSWKCLNSAAAFLAPTPSVVSLQNRVTLEEDEEEPIMTIVTPTRGHLILYEHLEKMEGLEKEEQTLVELSPLTSSLTQILTDQVYGDGREALQSLEVLGKAVPRRVCQHPFKKNDIVWVCRTCQADETCVLCHNCFSQSNHEGHDVAFYHAQAGGCCDCGDPDAWDPAGFCPHHGPSQTRSSEDANALPKGLVSRVRGVVPAAVDWMVREIATNAERAFDRAHPPKGTSSPRRRRSASPLARTRRSLTQSFIAEASAMSSGASLPTAMDVDDDEFFHQNFMEEDHDDDDDQLSDSSWDGEFFIRDSLQHHHHAQVFSPTAASTSKSDREELQRLHDEKAEELGRVGAGGGGLYLVLHADDIHSSQQLLDAIREYLGSDSYFTDTLLSNFVKALRQYGQLVVWGIMELVSECGATQVHLWMDGDKVASTRIGAIMLERAGRLTRHGLFCSIVTRDELVLEQRAVAVIQWLSAVARSCDPLCQTVAECILPNRHLVPLLRADFKMSARVTKAWYSLLLTLLAVPTFKSHLAAAYCDTYRTVTAKYARGMGVLERSGYTLSVQFLNRVTYVVDLVRSRDLLGKLGKSLLETLLVASKQHDSNRRLNPNHFVLTHRRYSPCISDLKCVLNVQGMPRIIACRGGTFLKDWIDTLRVAQCMDPQVWRDWTQGHVEEESRGWVGAFNASISLGSLYERLLGWEDEEKSPIDDPASPLSRDLMSCLELTMFILKDGLYNWQQGEFNMYNPTPNTSAIEPHKRCSASLPFPTTAFLHGTATAMKQLPVAQVTPFSFHLPLHRFVAGCLRELCMRPMSDQGGVAALVGRLRVELSEAERDSLCRGLMEFPLLILSRAAQVRANLWRRNGPGLSDQVLNYAEPPFCRTMRDADLLMAQFACLTRTQLLSQSQRPASDCGVTFLVNIMLHRLGIFDFCGFAAAPNANVLLYAAQVEQGLFDREPILLGDPDDDVPLPFTYSPARDLTASVTLLEEFLHFLVVFCSELPPEVPIDREGQTSQAKFRLFREVVHRLASGPKTHSELSEVHHVLSHRDNLLLSEEGKLVNPDDATGAALASVLSDVADRRVSRGKMEPDKWEMKPSAWEYYDPCFFHISLRCHQIAAEIRPKPAHGIEYPFEWQARPFCPKPIPSHHFFKRLRRDITADATVVAVAFRVLHVHCRLGSSLELGEEGPRGSENYGDKGKSETALARAVHLLTLGAFSWKDSDPNNRSWRNAGGGSAGSVFFNWDDSTKAPTARDWVKACLLAEPDKLLDSTWYDDKENSLLLLRRLAMTGGGCGGFVAQDAAVRCGAAWLCEFATSCCPEAAILARPQKKTVDGSSVAGESELERRRKLAKEKALAMMKSRAEKFASMMEVDLDNSEDEVEHHIRVMKMSPLRPPGRPMRAASFASTMSSASSIMSGDSDSGMLSSDAASGSEVFGNEAAGIPPRLLQTRPQCIICNGEENSETFMADQIESDTGESQRKKSKRKNDNALGFVGYTQPSTVMKGGGGPPPTSVSTVAPVSEFVGMHVALCGHAIHSECCESYLATVTHREDRAMGKRDEFRCPLCQRLSNCLIPFIDVGADWIQSQAGEAVNNIDDDKKVSSHSSEMKVDFVSTRQPLGDFLDRTPWWVTHRGDGVVWDGHSAYVEETGTSEESLEVAASRKPARRIRSLKKKDLYSAWNAMMRTPRFVRRRLRTRGRQEARKVSGSPHESPRLLLDSEESSGETVVWRRFMEQVADLSYKADTKRLGEDQLHHTFGEFRHYIVEKYAYNVINRFTGAEPVDWPSCMFSEPLDDNKRQELSREKLLSKLFLSIQSFTYSCCCEGFEARRAFRRYQGVILNGTGLVGDSNLNSILSRFGIRGISIDGVTVVMLPPVLNEEDGSQPFQGRLGKLRYLGLAVMAASGAVAADMVQLAIGLPTKTLSPMSQNAITPVRAPIAYPILFGHVLTHIVAAMCASCGRARAYSDGLEYAWPVPFSSRGSFAWSDESAGGSPISVVDDCEGFIKLGLLARILQVMLAKLDAPVTGFSRPKYIATVVRKVVDAMPSTTSAAELTWKRSCTQLLEAGLTNAFKSETEEVLSFSPAVTSEQVHDAFELACTEACSYLSEVALIFQILVPSAATRFDSIALEDNVEMRSIYVNFEKITACLRMEGLHDMVDSPSTCTIVAGWYDVACQSSTVSAVDSLHVADNRVSLRKRLFRTQGFRAHDWPSCDISRGLVPKLSPDKEMAAREPISTHFETSIPVLNISTPSFYTQTADVVRKTASPPLVTFTSTKSVPLLGGYIPNPMFSKDNARPRVATIPTSYTDLYAELGSLMPDCEQTAVCLICGEVLNASGKGECTRHSYTCGAGAGMFFLLQECSGLIMHKSKAAYIHSPYVDSHGETPQFRGRPLNLDLDRYEHLRDVWYGHGIRQQVVAERGSSRQVILPEFY